MLRKSNKGFTLIELLTVIAIIGILAAILIPTVGAAKNSAKKAKSRVQFSQWATAMGLFRQEYGYYPDVASSDKVDAAKFAGALTGRSLTGTAKTDPTGQNTKFLSFYSIADSEISTDQQHLVDAFGNTDIVVCIDSDGDGIIKGGELKAIAVTPIDGTAVTPQTGTGSGQIDTTNGIRAGAIFYSAGKGSGPTDIVYSWQ